MAALHLQSGAFSHQAPLQQVPRRVHRRVALATAAPTHPKGVELPTPPSWEVHLEGRRPPIGSVEHAEQELPARYDSLGVADPLDPGAES